MNKQVFSNLLLFICLFLFTGSVFASQEVTVFTYRQPESKRDVRYEYDNSLLKLALEKTVQTDGPYKLVPSPIMNYARAHEFLKNNTLPNLFIKLSYESVFEEKGLSYVSFPVDLGIVGYRVCFANTDTVAELAKVSSLTELQRYTHGQGIGWSDVKILEHNGFSVTEIVKYENLFSMVANRRFDLFCRGANELQEELKAHQDIENLSYDKSLTIYYPLPRFFYTNAANRDALDRVQRGLKRAYEDGTLEELWKQQYGKSIEFVKLENRKVFSLENPLIKNLKDDYQQFFYQPNANQ